MFVLLLLASYVAGEWVEISQNHYRKEPSRRVIVNNRSTAVANRIYANYTLTERPWNQGVVVKIPNRVNIERVQLSSKARDKISRGRPERISSSERTNTDREYENFGPDHFENKNIKRKLIEGDKLNDESGKINEKSNVGLQAPSELFNKPSPYFEELNEYAKFPLDKKLKFEDEHSLKSVQSSGEYLDDNFNKSFKERDNKVKSHVDDKRIEDSIIVKPKNITLSRIASFLPEDILVSQNTVTKAKHEHRNAPTSKSESDIVVKEINKSSFQKESDTEIEIENSTKVTKELNFQRKNTDDGKKSNVDGNTDDGKKSNVDGDAFHRTDDNLDKSSKSNTVEVIWKLMKVVTDNISRNTRRSFRSKVRYLEGLRNTILSNIEARIEEVWPDEADGAGARRRRSARGHVEFPSSESALMTISFLTFAVFLIKLVLQVIHTYKNKTMMVTPAVVAAVGRAAATLTHQLPDN